MLSGLSPLARDAQGGPPREAGSRRGRVTGGFFHLVAGMETEID